MGRYRTPAFGRLLPSICEVRGRNCSFGRDTQMRSLALSHIGNLIPIWLSLSVVVKGWREADQWTFKSATKSHSGIPLRGRFMDADYRPALQSRCDQHFDIEVDCSLGTSQSEFEQIEQRRPSREHEKRI
jgi:hypothetical protein